MSTGVRQFDASLLRLGEQFAGYRVEAGLGRQSGVGRVYEATHVDSGRRVALKVFSAQALRDRGLEEHFSKSAKAQARLRHSNVVAVEEWGTAPAPYMVMTLVRGVTLADLSEQGELDDGRALAILAAVAEGLEAGRRRGLTYRRLQPRGVLVDVEAGHKAYLADFGASRPPRSTDAIETGRLGAFADYISPEEADDGETTQASVVYSLGAMLFECLTGGAPYASGPPWSTLRAHMEAPPRSLREEREDLPQELDAVLQKAMAKEPRARQGTAAALVRDVDLAYPAAARAEVGTEKRPRRRPRLRAGALVLAAVLLVAVFAALGVAASGGSDSGSRPQPAKRLSNASLRLSYPAAWTESKRSPAIPGVRLRDAVSVSPSDSLDDGELVTGQVTAGSLPQARAEVVDLGAVTARRYSGLREPGSSRRVVAYAVPAQGGAVVAACFQSAGTGSFADRCARAASTLRPRRPGTAPSAASPRYAQRLNRGVGRVARVRERGRRRLARASTRAGQGRVAARLGRDYGTLSGVLAGIEAPGAARTAQRTVLAQLRRAGRGYRDMGRAARRRRPGAWLAARRGVRSAEGRFQGALGSLRRLGYDVGRGE